MAKALSDQVSLHWLSALRGELSVLTVREAAGFGERQAEELGEDFLEEVNARLGSENELIRSLALKCIECLASFEAVREQYEAQVGALGEEVEEKAVAGENLQEIVSHLERKVASYEQEYQKVKGDLIHLSERHERLEGECAHLRAQLAAAQKHLEATHDRDKHQISTLASEKELLLDQIKTERRANAELREELALLESRWGDLERECRLQAVRLGDALKYSKEMENILDEKNDTIARLEGELESLRAHRLALPEAHPATYFDPHDDPEGDPVRLEDDIPFCEPFLYCPGRLVVLNEEEGSAVVGKMSLDPYFSHFVLTSQSVKIKEDCQELLNIDAKPFYAEIVEKRIPMHLWDQWIRNKLKEELRLRTAAPSDSDEE